MLAYFWMGAIGVSVLSISFYVLHTLCLLSLFFVDSSEKGVCLDF